MGDVRPDRGGPALQGGRGERQEVAHRGSGAGRGGGVATAADLGGGGGEGARVGAAGARGRERGEEAGRAAGEDGILVAGWEGLPRAAIRDRPSAAIRQARPHQAGEQGADMVIRLINGAPPETLQTLWQPWLQLPA